MYAFVDVISSVSASSLGGEETALSQFFSGAVNAAVAMRIENVRCRPSPVLLLAAPSEIRVSGFHAAAVST